MKLNLGSGAAPRPGFVNCDRPTTAYGTHPDVACDLLALPFRDGAAAEIQAIHVWEHFTPAECRALLREWGRVLAADGRLVLELPSLTKVLAHFAAHAPDYMTRQALYGEHHDHRWCWREEELVHFLDYFGYDCRVRPAQHHIPARDMRVEAWRP